MNTGYLGDTTPKLGFGLMRLPMIGDEIDMEQTKAMVDTFMAKGFTYFDTAYVYINGKSEVAAREAIVIASATVTCPSGSKRPAPVPFMRPSSNALATSEAYHSDAGTSVN